MTFLTPGTTMCFLCSRSIASRVEAAQLAYASPDDVGELAHHGRAWVHRACWTTWALRDVWSRSSTRLMASDPHAWTARAVVARVTPSGVLVTDLHAALGITIPRDRIDELRRALAATVVTSIAFGHATWTWTPTDAGIRLVATHDGQVFEDVLIEDPQAWTDILGRVAAA